MSVLRPTTTVSIRRGTAEIDGDVVDPWDTEDRQWDADTTVVAFGIAAAFSSPREENTISGGTRTGTKWTVILDPCDVLPGDVVEDEATTRRYQVASALRRPGIMVDADGSGSLDHVRCEVVEIVGAT